MTDNATASADVRKSQNERIEIVYRKSSPIDDPQARYPGFKPGTSTLAAGSIHRKGALPLPCDIIFERDVAVPMRDGITHLHTLGLTALHDARLMGGLEGAAALKAWQQLNEKDKLDLRCWVSLAGERLEEAIALGLRTGLGDERLRIGHVKYFADGGMGARTAWMLEPYLDAEYVMPLGSMAELGRKLQRRKRRGWP